jgi:hypothetical protein
VPVVGVAAGFGAQDRDRVAGDLLPAVEELGSPGFKNMNRAMFAVAVTSANTGE